MMDSEARAIVSAMDAHSPDRPTVIVVDDDAALLRALGFSLELEGFAVEKHRAAVSIRPETLPSHNACLVIDYYLPDTDGVQLLETLRAGDVTLPAIIITTHARPQLRLAAKRLGATIVEKPLIGPALSSEIRALLKTASAKKEPALPNDQICFERIVLELAREPAHPEGDPSERYVLVAPLTDNGQLDGNAWPTAREHCRVARESGHHAISLGHLVHGPGGHWTLQFDITNDRPDEKGFHFEDERFVPGEYISIEREGGTHTFRVMSSTPVRV
jgi:CheY-like chemotaxis protein